MIIAKIANPKTDIKNSFFVAFFTVISTCFLLTNFISVFLQSNLAYTEERRNTSFLQQFKLELEFDCYCHKQQVDFECDFCCLWLFVFEEVQLYHLLSTLFIIYLIRYKSKYFYKKTPAFLPMSSSIFLYFYPNNQNKNNKFNNCYCWNYHASIAFSSKSNRCCNTDL